MQRSAMLLHKSACSSEGNAGVTSSNMPKYKLVPQKCPQQQYVSCSANVILMIKSISSMPMGSGFDKSLFEVTLDMLSNKHPCCLHAYSILYDCIIRPNPLTIPDSKQYQQNAIELKHHSYSWHVDHVSCHSSQWIGD